MASESDNSWWKAEVSRRFAAKTDDSVRDLVGVLRSLAKPGQPVPSKSSIGAFVKGLRSAASDPVPIAPPPVHTPPPEASDDADDAEMSPEEFATWLGRQLRQAQADATHFRANADQPAAARAMRLAAQLAALLAKVHARASDEGDVIRMPMSEVTAAAERMRSKFHDLVARLSGERT